VAHSIVFGRIEPMIAQGGEILDALADIRAWVNCDEFAPEDVIVEL